MNAHVDIGGSEVLALKGALLVYQGRGRGFVTWHEARRNDEEDSAPYLGEAQQFTTEFLRELAQGLGARIPTEVFPESVVARTAETIVWWTPSTVRPMFFAAHDVEAYELNAKRLPQPPLVWKVSGSNLWVRALPENHRPTAETQLMIAPYWNVDGETGWTCQGSMRSPDEFGVNSIPLWEQAFFQSEFTHHTGAKRLTSHPGGFLGLWTELANGRRRFPFKHLAPAGETLREFVMRN
jgi:PRTRC genetic system protein B